ncbi:hypothetical protein Q7M73_05480 (plasmid) [Candidatus Liberibacter asiaticus]|uniref:hypothetical protein n=1 Tax=Liberibacter asiaticus TaxID=34021 RepID=UPI0012F4DBB9|nr:hypothetical protein [Candidatus Liberibacter asiaticus]KAE9513882.1 hypothetical protein FXW25_05420 [Candidatus Liberibacter asiaticus]KAE9515997.1 hypothetical protein FXW27_05335 [Candidatus Liberibacter asiaticus]
MGQLKQYYLEEIEANYEFLSAVNPRMGIEPESNYEVEVIEKLERALKTSKKLIHFRDRTIRTHILEDLIEEVNRIIVLAKAHKRRLELKIFEDNEVWRLLDEACEACEDCEGCENCSEHPDQEHKEDYYASQI